jgi:hypothetical protein
MSAYDPKRTLSVEGEFSGVTLARGSWPVPGDELRSSNAIAKLESDVNPKNPVILI